MVDRSVTVTELRSHARESGSLLQCAIALEIKMACKQFQTSTFAWSELMALVNRWKAGTVDDLETLAAIQRLNRIGRET